MLDRNSVCYRHQRSVFGEVRYWLLPRAKKEWLGDSNIMEVDVTVPASPLHWHQPRQVCPWSNSLGYRNAFLRYMYMQYGGWDLRVGAVPSTGREPNWQCASWEHFPCASNFHSCPSWIQVSCATTEARSRRQGPTVVALSLLTSGRLLAFRSLASLSPCVQNDVEMVHFVRLAAEACITCREIRKRHPTMSPQRRDSLC